MNKIDVSVVILNFNTKDLVVQSIKSILQFTKDINYEIVVVDNASVDGSVEAIQKLLIKNQNIKLIKNNNNLGFAKGNNVAKKYVRGKYILFLNSDTKINENVLKKSLIYLNENENIGALSVKHKLFNGKIDKDARRSFPTPWVAFTHFSKLDRLFPKSKLFARYWVGYQSDDQTQEIEALQGSFFMSPKSVLDKVGWFDEDYFLDGEDIDLSWKIKKLGYKNVYFADTHIVHLKGASKGKRGSNRKRTFKQRIKFVTNGVNSMEIFYRKRLWDKNNILINYFMILLIKLMKVYRVSMLVIKG